MTAPLDLDAIRVKIEAANATYEPHSLGVQLAAVRALVADAPALLAEVERLQRQVGELHGILIDNTHALRTVLHGSSSAMACTPKEAWELTLAEVERLRADSVPRSSLVQVGWLHDGETLTGWRADDTDRCQPVYVIREDTDA